MLRFGFMSYRTTLSSFSRLCWSEVERRFSALVTGQWVRRNGVQRIQRDPRFDRQTCERSTANSANQVAVISKHEGWRGEPAT